MKRMSKRIVLLISVVMLICGVLAISAYADDSSLWSQKPTEGAVHSGYCLDYNGAETNIKFEVYKEGGTDDAPEYTIYFFMVDENGGSVVYPGRNADFGYGYDATTTDAQGQANCAIGSGRAGAQVWYASDIYDCQKITKAVFGDGITELGGTSSARGILTCLQGLTTVEFPASLTRMVSATFESCLKLSTVYTRGVGQTVEEGTVNLSNFTHMNFGAFAFSNCQAVQKYIFADTVTTDTPQMGTNCFSVNCSLKSMNLPNGITKTNSKIFYGNPGQWQTWTFNQMEEITLPATLTEICASTFLHCTSLKTVNIMGETTAVYPVGGAATTADAIASGTTFEGCTALTTINAPEGSPAHTFAVTSGFEWNAVEVPEVTLPIETVTSSCGLLIMTYDPNTKTMTVDTESTSWVDFKPAHWWNSGTEAGSVHCAEPVNFMQKYKTEVEHFVIGSNIDKLSHGDSTYSAFFDGFTALETVRFTNAIQLALGSKGNLFANCPNLTSVYVGDESNAQEGVADLSSFTSCDSGVLIGLFTNCTSIKKVLLPAAAGATSIYSSTFDGCTALETVSIPANITAIAPDAFVDCTALTTIIAPEGSVGYDYASENGLLPTLWSQKPTDTTNLVHSGNCIDDTGATTNIKFEVYNMGTTDAPDYTIYFFMEDKNGGSVVYPGSTSGGYVDVTHDLSYHLASKSTVGLMAYYSNAYDATKITKAVFGDGITELGGPSNARGILQGLTGLTTVEFPASLTKMSSATFITCSSLSTVYTRGVDQVIKTGVVNLSNFTHINFGAYAFSWCLKVVKYVFADVITTDTPNIGECCFSFNQALTSLTIPSGIQSLGKDLFVGCDLREDPHKWCWNWSLCKITEITILGTNTAISDSTFTSCYNLTTINAPVGSPAHTYAMANGYDTTHYSIFTEEDGGQAKLEYFPDTQHMSITKIDGTGWVELLWNDSTVQTFLATYKGLVKTADVGDIDKIRGNGSSDFSGLFEDFTALTEVHFESLRLTPHWGCTEVDLFKGCSALTTVWIGDDANKIDGVINLTGLTNTDDNSALVLKGMFSGCSSITKVILPELSDSYVTNEGETVYLTSVIHANTFENCTSLKEIVIPANYDTVEAGAFSTCTALRKIELKADEITMPGTAFAGCTGVIIYCENTTAAKDVNAQLTTDGIEASTAMAFVPAMDILGYQVRESSYNGLRACFSFNENIWGEDSDFNLVEYGSIVATAENYKKYEAKLGEGMLLASDGNGGYVTPLDTIIKTTIWNAKGYHNNSNHSDTSAVRFNTTIVRFSGVDQYKANVAMVGYEIWEKDGEYFAFFTEYDANPDYSTISLYKATVGMASAEDSGISVVKGDNPIWNTLAGSEPEAIVTDNENVTGLLLPDPINSGKYVAFYGTDASETASISDMGLSKAVRENLTAAVFGVNVSYALPELDTVWADYMPEKLASIPAGKSFVFITDTHWENNAQKSSELIEYVRKATGITNVIYGGDPFDGFNSLNDAENALVEYAQTNFYDVFGEDGIYVVGNHDVNNTASGGSAELTISDTFLYDTTVKNIEDKAVFDTDMLAALENITYTDVLYSDSTVAYTAEQMKEQAIAWAKMHYHYDNEDEKMRYIVLDTGSNGITQLNTIKGNYTSFMSIEYDWLAKTLLSTPTDYDIVVLGHQIGAAEANNTASQDLFKILSAFKAKTTLTTNLTAHSDNTKLIMGGDTARTYDFTGSTFEGTIFSMNGHWHFDRSWIWQTELGTYCTNVAYSDSLTLSDDAILSICSNRDASYSPGELEMTRGTTTEQSFNVVTITDDGRIVVTRFGAGEDRIFNYQ